MQPYGMFVEVLDPPVDGLVRIDTITGPTGSAGEQRRECPVTKAGHRADGAR
ncbi:MAG: hypothetical protein MZV70_72945 [Desulfobacterales bacterium]|nr:hypothetical protein [Desulfobacterales bacterium]